VQVSSQALPRAVLLDLDDTILDDSSRVDRCWREACAAHARELTGVDQALVLDEIRQTSRWFWGDPERHRSGRLDLNNARREVVRLAFRRLAIGRTALADKIADLYSHQRGIGMEPLPDAIDTVRWLRGSGCRLALLTNGAAEAQRTKIVRFGLAELFDAILVEGELGFGKPDERVYALALEQLAVAPSEAWMVGDNLEWDVASPQRLGLFTIWIDVRGKGLPKTSGVRPGRIVRALSELRLAR
jgi:putative hydrolase of the HAD superfamily